METKKSTPKKEKTVRLLLSDKFLKDMSSEVMGFYKKQLNLANELNEVRTKPISSISSAETMLSSVFQKLFFGEKIEKPVFVTFLTLDRQQKSTEKLLKELTGIYNEPLDISIEKNKCILKMQYSN